MRIVAGAAKGRRLAPPAPVTRPTSDGVREAMFNSLASRMNIEGARVLDLYAGTGAVGLEALSRGADEAVLVESNRRALEVIRRNVESVGLSGASVVASPVNTFLGTEPEQPFDLIFADPPYADFGNRSLGLLISIFDRGWVGRDGYVVFEGPESAAGAAAGLPEVTTVEERRYGDTVLWYGRRR